MDHVITVGPNKDKTSCWTLQDLAYSAPDFPDEADLIEFHNEVIHYHSLQEWFGRRTGTLCRAIAQQRGAKVLWLRIFRKRTLRDVGWQLGISKERVRQIERKARRGIVRQRNWRRN